MLFIPPTDFGVTLFARHRVALTCTRITDAISVYHIYIVIITTQPVINSRTSVSGLMYQKCSGKNTRGSLAPGDQLFVTKALIAPSARRNHSCYIQNHYCHQLLLVCGMRE